MFSPQSLGAEEDIARIGRVAALHVREQVLLGASESIHEVSAAERFFRVAMRVEGRRYRCLSSLLLAGCVLGLV